MTKTEILADSDAIFPVNIEDVSFKCQVVKVGPRLHDLALDSKRMP